MPLNKKELGKLSPEERIRKLKLMEEERKKEVSEIGRLINESMQEIKTEKLAEEIAPEQKAVDISRLFETDAGENLERTARKEGGVGDLTKGSKDYQTFAQAYQDYSSLKKLMGYAATGSLNEEHQAVIDEINERLDKTKYQNIGAEIANILVASKATLHKIRKYAGM
ncbi:hypothetical protein J4480_00080 [Candidatus Woesearchaeota archaeon]|nr:hypothetical protein [Candidatus Woesearchaeota archaeon]